MFTLAERLFSRWGSAAWYRGRVWRFGACARGYRSRVWLWLSGGGHRLLAIYLWIVFQTRSEHFAAGRAGGHASDGGRASAPTCLSRGWRSAAPSLQGLGILGRGIDGEPSFLSGA